MSHEPCGRWKGRGRPGSSSRIRSFPSAADIWKESRSSLPEDMIAKIKAALDARSDPDFIIMARTDALAVFGHTTGDRAGQFVS